MKKRIKAEEWKYDKYYREYQYAGDPEKYYEQEQALPTSRVLNGSRDNGYMAEYVGYGSIGAVPVIAVYLIGYDEENVEDEGDYDWDKALERGRIIIDVDELTDADYETITSLIN